MGEPDYDYGSEWNLRQWIEQRRNAFDSHVLEIMKRPDKQIEWLYPNSHNPTHANKEYRGLEFIDDPELGSAWREFWPRTGNPPNWDAVGRLAGGTGGPEWILVEAKARLGEIKSKCRAKEKSKEKITQAFQETRSALGVMNSNDWTKQYFQYANRIAVLFFLHQHNVPANLLNIYFVGDTPRRGRLCPKTQEGWHSTLDNQSLYIGLPSEHVLKARIFRLFLPALSEGTPRAL